MKYQYYMQETNFTVKNIDIQTVSRPRGHRHSFRDGRSKHGLVYTVSGRMRDDFLSNEKKSVTVDAGELIFIPKGSIYTGEYLEDGTCLKIIQFDLASGALPSYLSAPVKIGLPNAGELIESFFKTTKSHTPNHPFYYLSRLCTSCYGRSTRANRGFPQSTKSSSLRYPSSTSIGTKTRRSPITPSFAI